MIPLWLMIAQGVKKVSDNQNKQIDDFNKNQQYTPNSQLMNNVNVNGNSDGGLGNAFSTFSSIYGNYLDSSELDSSELDSSELDSSELDSSELDSSKLDSSNLVDEKKKKLFQQ